MWTLFCNWESLCMCWLYCLLHNAIECFHCRLMLLYCCIIVLLCCFIYMCICLSICLNIARINAYHYCGINATRSGLSRAYFANKVVAVAVVVDWMGSICSYFPVGHHQDIAIFDRDLWGCRPYYSHYPFGIAVNSQNPEGFLCE